MTAKEYLGQAFHLDQRINTKLEMLSSLREMVTKTTGVMSDDVVSRTRNVHSMQDTIVKIVDMQTEINSDVDRLVDLKREIMHTIFDVRNTEYRTLLELRYICFNSWEDIALKMNCTVSNVFKLHSRALAHVKIPKSGS